MEGAESTGPLEAIQLARVGEAATALRVSKRTIYRMIREDELDAVRVRGRIRIPMPAIAEYIKAHTNGQSPEVA